LLQAFEIITPITAAVVIPSDSAVRITPSLNEAYVNAH
jgi:hypothetical protein